MSSTEDRAETLAKLAQSRAEIKRVLDPPPPRPYVPGVNEQHVDEAHGGSFPRSRTMKMLLTGKGVGTVGAVVGGLLMARPTLAFRLLRMIPAGAVAKMLVIKGLTSIRSKSRE